MKRSAGKAELLSEQEEPLDAAGEAVEPTQGLELEPHRVQDQGNIGEGSIQAASGVALQSTEAGLGLESCSFQDVERGSIQADREFAVQPTEAGLGLESHNFQEQPNVEEVAIQANTGVAEELVQAGSGFELSNFQEQPNVEEGAILPIYGVVQPMQADLGIESHSFQEQSVVEERGGVVVQPTQTALPSPSYLDDISIEDLNDILHTVPDEEEHDIIEEILLMVTGQIEPSHPEQEADRNDRIVLQDMNNLRNGEVEALHQEEEAGINDRIVPQTPPSDLNSLINGQVETSHQEEAAGINDRIVPQAPPFDMDDLRNNGWIELADLDEPMNDEEDTGIQARASRQQMQNWSPQQGTAGRRMRLQVPLCAEGPSEPKCVLIASSERTYMCGGMSLEQEAKLLPTEPADLFHKYATSSSARVTMQEEGDKIGPLCAEGSAACVTESDHPDVAEQASQDVSGSSLTSIVHLFLGFLGDACILPAFAAELSKETDGLEDGFDSSVGCSETELEGRQSMVCHSNSTRPFLQQRMTPSSSIKEIETTKPQHELAQAVSSGDRRKLCMGRSSGIALCLFWIATLALIFLCFFRSFCRLTRTAFTSV